MKHLFTLITTTGLAFSTEAFAEEHQTEPCSTPDGTDSYYADDGDGFDVGYDCADPKGDHDGDR
jgi:hypothetical protein